MKHAKISLSTLSDDEMRSDVAMPRGNTSDYLKKHLNITEAGSSDERCFASLVCPPGDGTNGIVQCSGAAGSCDGYTSSGIYVGVKCGDYSEECSKAVFQGWDCSELYDELEDKEKACCNKEVSDSCEYMYHTLSGQSGYVRGWCKYRFAAPGLYCSETR